MSISMQNSRTRRRDASETRAEQPLEVTLVKRLCRIPLADEVLHSIGSLATSGVDWGSVLRVASDMDVEALVLSNLRAHFLDAIPAAYSAEIVKREREARAFAIRGSLLSVEAARMLETAGIPAIVMKGPAIGVLAYGDPSLRGFADIDLLVRRDDAELAREVVLKNGYARDYDAHNEHRLLRDQHALEFSSSKAKLELHVALLSKHLSFSIPAQDLWESARAVDFSGQSIMTLSRPHLLVFLCAHGAKHQWWNFKWIVDIAQLLERMTNAEITEAESVASAAGARRLLGIGLGAARNLESAHPELLDVSPESRGWRDHLGRIHHGLPVLAYWAGARERLSDKIYPFLRLAMRSLFK